MFTKASVLGIALACFAVLISPEAGLAVGSLDVSQIDNFQQVTPTLCRGAQPSLTNLRELAEHGVKTIVDLRDFRTAKEEKAANALGMHYIHIPLLFSTPDPEKVNEFLSIVNDPANGQIYVHCRQGADRTGMLCAIYRITSQKWTFEQAWTEMRLHHFKPWLGAMKATVKSFAEEATANANEQAANVAKTVATKTVPAVSAAVSSQL